MFEIDFSHPIHVHFIGIGGISMSGLAQILNKEGFLVSGSDRDASVLTKTLEEAGIRVMIGQRAENITPELELVVYTAAIHPDNPEFAAARAAGIPMLTRAQLLGQIMRNYQSAVAVAGTHGKTTTTSMLSHITLAAALDPTISVGGMLKAIGGNIRVGGNDLIITEACEYTNSFLSFYPTIGIILNIDADHLDFFKDLDDIRRSFYAFARLLPPEGTLVLPADLPDLASFTQDLRCQVVTFGGADGTYHASDLSYDEAGNGSFTLVADGKEEVRVQLQVPGEHNVGNALAAIAAACALGISFADMAKGLHAFTGTDRRFELKGTRDGFTIVDDYAHHPAEISATLKAARHACRGDVWCVFQPHTYTRTRALFDDFVSSLQAADHIIVADIYAARETDTLGMSAALLAKHLSDQGADACHPGDFAAIEAYLLSHAKPGDLVLTMGAGNVVQVGEHLLSRN